MKTIAPEVVTSMLPKGAREADGPTQAFIFVGRHTVDPVPVEYVATEYGVTCDTEDAVIRALASYLGTLPDNCCILWRVRPETNEWAADGEFCPILGKTIAPERRYKKRYMGYLRYFLVDAQDFEMLRDYAAALDSEPKE